jgi:hypothetical protein
VAGGGVWEEEGGVWDVSVQDGGRGWDESEEVRGCVCGAEGGRWGGVFM